MKIGVCGRIQTGSYTNREGRKVYTTDIVVEEHTFCEKREDGSGYNGKHATDQHTDENGFLDVTDDIYNDLPFA